LTLQRSFDPKLLEEALSTVPDEKDGVDYEAWINNHNNVMLVENDNVGLASYEYPGVYNVHWFYKSAKGRGAINLAKRMLTYMFEHGAQTIRGLTREDHRAARWLAKQVGLTSYGFVQYPDEELRHEIMFITKDEFNGS